MAYKNMKRRTFLKIAASSLLWAVGCVQRHASGFLRVDSGKVVDDAGIEVILRGFNAGFKYFSSVLGEEDIERISLLGGNCLRLWFEQREFEPHPYEYRRESFRLLERVLDWCGKHGVYAILCNHLAPGGQNPHDFIVGASANYTFWKESENQARFYDLWYEIARRCASKRALAGYDLLNEGVPPDTKTYTSVLNRATEAVRAADERHMLVVEEARLPAPGGQRKVLLPVEDENTLYSIHFFFPAQFTLYATLSTRAIGTYPGEVMSEGEVIAETRTPPLRGSFDWRRIVLRANPPSGAEVLVVRLVSRGNSGRVWFDDLRLLINGRAIDLPASLVQNPSFEGEYYGSTWRNSGGVFVNNEAHTGRRSLLFESTSRAEVKSSPIAVEEGEYLLSAWVKAENATGDSYLAISWHRPRVVAKLTRRTLEERLGYALKFSRAQRVPLLVGEFTCHRNPSEQSVVNYLRDLLAIMQENHLHWCYWAYYSPVPEIGIYSGNAPRLTRREVAEVLRGYLSSDIP